MEEKAMLRSETAAGGTTGATEAAGLVVDDCAYPNFVRSRPEANARPPRNAATSAPPKVIREIEFFMALPDLRVFFNRVQGSGSGFREAKSFKLNGA